MSTPRGAHNSSSISGGIFGEGPVNRAAPAPRAVDRIFGDNTEQSSRPSTANRMNASSVAGGIFGADGSQESNGPRRSVTTKSSVEGGIFSASSAYGQMEAYPEPPRSARGAKPTIDANRIAGQATVKDSGSWFQDGTAPLAPISSGRSNPNKPSVEGGIFGGPPPMNKPHISRSNPNASSISGGIFG